jgi:hypothetical protein
MKFLEVQTFGHRSGIGSSGRRRHRRHLLAGRGFHCSLTAVTEMRPDLVCEVVIQRAGMRFLVLNTEPRQILQNDVALYFQLACEFVNPNLPHA